MSQNMKKHEDSTHVLIIDDFSLFSVLSADRDCIKIGNFLKRFCSKLHRVFTFANQNTLTSPEISKLYEVASAVAVLTSLQQGTQNNEQFQAQKNILICDLLKIREERRVSHEV